MKSLRIPYFSIFPLNLFQGALHLTHSVVPWLTLAFLFWSKLIAFSRNPGQHRLASYWFCLHYKHIPEPIVWARGMDRDWLKLIGSVPELVVGSILPKT